MNIKQKLESAALNKVMSIVGQVVKKIETSGPTIYLINDGTGIVSAKQFKGNGNIKDGDYVTVCGTVQVYNGEREINVSTIKHSDDARSVMEKRLKELAEPVTSKFTVQAEYLELLKPEMQKAARIIRHAVLSNRPIYIRHHCDVDGFSGGLQIEKAIKQIATDPKYRLRRSTMRAPFFEMVDIMRDISMAETDHERYGDAKPLVIVLDNGSSTQDVDAMFLGIQHGFDFVVVDHHVLGDRDAITPITLAHVNQLRVGKYESCTGFLAFELARMISPDYKDFAMIPAVAGISDRVDDNVFGQYLARAGADKELLTKYEQVLTWLLNEIPFCDNTAFLNKLFWSDAKYKQTLVNQYWSQLNDKCTKAMSIMEIIKDVQNVNGVDVAFLPVGEAFPRRAYPKIGMASGLFYDNMKNKNPKTIVCGMMSDGIVLRVAPDSNCDVHSIIKYLDSKLPYDVEGGGHAVAGSVKLSKAILSVEEANKIKALVLEHVKERNS